MLSIGRPVARARSPAARNPASISSKMCAKSQRRCPLGRGILKPPDFLEQQFAGATPARNTRPLPAPRHGDVKGLLSRRFRLKAVHRTLHNAGGDAPGRGAPRPCAGDSRWRDRWRSDRSLRRRVRALARSRRDIGREGLLERTISALIAVAPLLRFGQGCAVDEVGLHVGPRSSTALIISDSIGSVTLCDWSSMYAGSKSGTLVQFGIDQLVEDQEKLERLDRAGVQIVVAVLAVVEMKAASLPNWISRATIISILTLGA